MDGEVVGRATDLSSLLLTSASYITSFSTSLPLGVEWISDDRTFSRPLASFDDWDPDTTLALSLAGLVVVFPSKISAASALNSLLADPTSPSILSALSTVLSSSATSSSFDADLPLVDVQPVPTHLWPVELRPVVARLRMDADEGGAVDPSDGGPMKEVLRVRWARSGDKKAARKVRFYRSPKIKPYGVVQFADHLNHPRAFLFRPSRPPFTKSTARARASRETHPTGRLKGGGMTSSRRRLRLIAKGARGGRRKGDGGGIVGIGRDRLTAVMLDGRWLSA